ncbi:Predicted membrane protein [Actinokineospora terrae]|uniref:Predicted membrane protein n=1 Tax=Actinokineospora terrae TaxID=155974 RepID=A0A1H9XC47_9PSEU|nr:Predicted membrane protein [Actinokineospora terrae]
MAHRSPVSAWVDQFGQTGGEHKGARLSFAAVLRKWGITVAAVMALFTVCVVAGAAAAEQPTFPSIPPTVPSIDFPIPKPGPTGTVKPPVIDPIPPTGGPSRPPGAVQPILPGSVNIQLKVERDGSLTVREQVIVRAKQRMVRVAPLRVGDRVFTVRNAKVEGNGAVDVTADTLTVRLDGGASTVLYTVDGTIDDLGDRQEFRWQPVSGWDTKLTLVRVSLLTPRPGRDFVCLAGRPGTEDTCQSALTDSGVLRVSQSDLDSGSRVDLSAKLPAGLVPANARYEKAASTAFAVTPLSGAGLGLVGLLLLGGFVFLWRAREREAKMLAAEVGPVELVVNDGGKVTFASPDGVLPGQAGALLAERAGHRELAATVVDLAVRNYLWVTESSGDWQIVRRNAADDALTDYERVVYRTLLPEGTESVTLSSLRTSPLDITAARTAIHADAVSRGWFTRTPGGLGRLGLVGAAVLAVGVVGALVLALTGGPALLAVAVGLGGLGLLTGARFVPVRTQRGSALAQQVRGVAAFLASVGPETVSSEREVVFSRSLPYAVALGESERWLTGFGPVDPAGVHWYASQDPDLGADQREFATRLTPFLGALDEAFGATEKH